MEKFEVILCQPYLRKFVLNFGKYLARFHFHNVASPPIQGGGYARLPSFEGEVTRKKTSLKNRLRRFLGIPNIRIWSNSSGDLIFTYGALVLTKKPYCTYIENGLALYNYDLGIGRNPLAKLLISYFATRENCKALIFVSEASRKSFFSTIGYSPKVRRILEEKSSVVYPIPIEKIESPIRKFNGKLRLIFVGQFYMKGGLEIAHAFERLREKHPNVSLTMITAFHIIKPSDIDYLKTIPGLNLLDAKLNEQEMIEAYRSHDVFLLPTFREGFGLVIVEALAYGLPVIITDQYATSEMAVDGYNGFVYPSHPLKDYDPVTYEMFGRYYNPIDFYRALFKLQENHQLIKVEDFIESSVEKFLDKPETLEEFSRHSLEIYSQKFDPKKLGHQIEEIFLEAVKK